MSDAYRSYVPNNTDGLFYNYGQNNGAFPINPATPIQSQTTQYLGGPQPGYLDQVLGDPTDSGGQPTGIATQADATVGGGLLAAISGKPSVVTSINNAAQNPTSQNIAAAVASMLHLGIGLAVPPMGLAAMIPSIAAKLGLNGPTSGTVAPGKNSTNNAVNDLNSILPPNTPNRPPNPNPNPAPAGGGANGGAGPSAGPGPGAAAPGAAPGPGPGPGTGPGDTGPGNTGPGNTGPGNAGPGAGGPGGSGGPGNTGPGGPSSDAAAAAAAAATSAATSEAAPAPDAAPAGTSAAAAAEGTGPGAGEGSSTSGGGAGSGPGGGGEAGEGNSGGTGGGEGPGASPGGEGPGPGDSGNDSGSAANVYRGGRISYDKFKSKKDRLIWHTETPPAYEKFKDGGIARPIKKPKNNYFEGIWDDPRVIAEGAHANTAPEDEAMKTLFGYDRNELYDAYKDRVGNIPGESLLMPQKGNARGSEHTTNMMTPGNAQRMIDILSEAHERAPELSKGMHSWYAMEPVYNRLRELHGDDVAEDMYRKFNTFTGMSSPGSGVMTELARGIPANTLARMGRFADFEKYAGLPEGPERTGMPEDMRDVPGHPYHSTAQAGPMRRFVDTDEVRMGKPKVPLYIGASSIEPLGFQSDTPVPDSHFSRGIGLADVRTAKAYPNSSMTMPELRTLAPWFRKNVSDPLGIEAVPAQARLWGTLGHLTGVDTPVGAPKLELLSQHIMKRAKALGMDPWSARDAIISGEAFARGGVARAGHLM